MPNKAGELSSESDDEDAADDNDGNNDEDNPVKIKEEPFESQPIDDSPHSIQHPEDQNISQSAGDQGLLRYRPSPWMIPSSRKKRGYYTMPFKLEVIQFAKEHNKEQAARKYGIDHKCVTTWCQKEPEILKMMQEDSSRCRLAGGGAKIRHRNLEEKLLQWIEEHHRSGLHVSHSAIRSKALDLYHDEVLTAADLKNPFRASKGWLRKFLARHKIVCQELQNGPEMGGEQGARESEHAELNSASQTGPGHGEKVDGPLKVDRDEPVTRNLPTAMDTLPVTTMPRPSSSAVAPNFDGQLMPIPEAPCRPVSGSTAPDSSVTGPTPLPDS